MQRQSEVMIDEFRTRLEDNLEKFDLLFKDRFRLAWAVWILSKRECRCGNFIKGVAGRRLGFRGITDLAKYCQLSHNYIYGHDEHIASGSAA
jgi:hypothetical protein